MTRQRSLAASAAFAALALLVAACNGGGAAKVTLPPIPSVAAATPSAPASPGASAPAPTHPGPTYPPGCPTTQPPALGNADTRTITVGTELGKIEIKIEGKLSPIATGNFVALADCGWYDGVVFHRIVPGFVIQGGDGQFGRVPNVIPNLVGTGGPPYTIKDEKVTATYHRGTVAMARTSAPDSVGSQFFIVLDDSAAPTLAQYNTYQIIGEVTTGMDVADKIATAANGVEIPSDPVVMTTVTVATP
jgi:cyclophilin family peptidyl-prolyl cis-trans isomerase